MFTKRRPSNSPLKDKIGVRILLVINFLVSILAPLVIKAWNEDLFTPAEEVFFALSLFVVLTVCEISLLVRDVVTKIRSDFVLWEARDKTDSKIYEIRRMFHAVCENSFGSADLFVSFFSRKIDQLEALLIDATTKQEVRIDGTMFQVTSELLLSAFEGRAEDTFRAVHYCSDNAFFFDIHSKRYFRQVYELTRAKKIRQVRRLIIYANDAEIEGEKTQMLIAFHQHNDHYDYRLIGKEVFGRILDDFGLQYLMSDFGIYGDRYLYKGYVNTRDKIVGTYSKNQNEINRFIECFEACWISPSTKMIVMPPGTRGSVIEEFLGEICPPPACDTQRNGGKWVNLYRFLRPMLLKRATNSTGSVQNALGVAPSPCSSLDEE